MATEFTEADLEAYLDEALAAEMAATLEHQLRQDSSLLERLARINARRESGVHSLGEIWRKNQVGVPSREELGSYLLGVLPPEHAAYIKYRVETLQCTYTIANLRDLEQEQREGSDQIATRRRRYFETSAGYLDGESEEE